MDGMTAPARLNIEHLGLWVPAQGRDDVSGCCAIEFQTAKRTNAGILAALIARGFD
jgi:hypothetical protein